MTNYTIIPKYKNHLTKFSTEMHFISITTVMMIDSDDDDDDDTIKVCRE